MLQNSFFVFLLFQFYFKLVYAKTCPKGFRLKPTKLRLKTLFKNKVKQKLCQAVHFNHSKIFLLAAE